MGYTVIIAEKPSVGKAIAQVLGVTERHCEGPCGYIEGNGYRVTWGFGHLVGLKDPEEMGFDKQTLPIFPLSWDTKISGKKDANGKETEDPMKVKQMNYLKKLFMGCDSICVATDAGREGELIFRYIYEHMGCKKPFQRLWISSMTDEAIREGFRNLRPGSDYENLSMAAHLRSRADWLVGYNASRALRIASRYNGMLSLGRVQTPTLAMICSRYIEFKNFVPVPYWKIKLTTHKNDTSFSVLNFESKYVTEQAAAEDAARIRTQGNATVTKVEKKRSATKPPLLYDITTLQRDANKKFGFTAKETLDTVQFLYEAPNGYVTYPRTGSRYIPKDVFKTIPELIDKFRNSEKFGAAAQALSGTNLCTKSVDDSKVTDHHALLPTGKIPTELTTAQRKIYDLICGRMLEAFGQDFIADVTTVTMESAGVIFKTTGSVPLSMGWKGVFGMEQDEKKDEDDSGKLPELKEGEILNADNVETIRKETKPKPIHDEDSLLKEMETCGKNVDDEEIKEAMKDVGLGTPATRSGIIEGLVKKNYIQRDGKKLIPTNIGLQIYDIIKARKIANVTLTGEWERDLALVEKGEYDSQRFIKNIKEFVLECIEDIMNNTTPIENAENRKCPLCGKTMKSGKFSYWCGETEGGCGFKVPKEICGKKLPMTSIEKLLLGKDTDVIKGFVSQKSGKKFDAKLVIDREQKKIIFSLPSTSSGPKMENLVCPKCGKTLSDGKYVIECQCGFKMWKTVSGLILSEDNIRKILSGQTVQLKGLTSKAGKKYNAGLRLKDDRSGTEQVFDK